MKQLCLIAGSILTIGLMSACNVENETATSQIGSSEAQKNLMEAEQAENELAKLAELQKQVDTKATKGKSASKSAAKSVKNDRMPASEHAAPAAAPVAKHEEKKPSKKVAKKPEGHAPEAPQEVAKKELANEHTNVGAVAALNNAPKTASAHESKPGGIVRSWVYVVQVGSFRVKENAVKLEEKLKTSGFPVRMKEINHSKNGLLYVVQFEPTPNKDEADSWRSQVKAKASLDAQLVTRQD